MKKPTRLASKTFNLRRKNYPRKTKNYASFPITAQTPKNSTAKKQKPGIAVEEEKFEIQLPDTATKRASHHDHHAVSNVSSEAGTALPSVDQSCDTEEQENVVTNTTDHGKE